MIELLKLPPKHGQRKSTHCSRELHDEPADGGVATVKAQCKVLRMPMIASQFATLAEQAIREKKSHVGYLEARLAAEIEEREHNRIERRIREAHLPRMKTLRSSTSRSRPMSLRRRCATFQRAATSHAPTRCCSSANAELEKVISNRLVCSGVLAETAGALRYGGRAGE
jgi:hypothetical protein